MVLAHYQTVLNPNLSFGLLGDFSFVGDDDNGDVLTIELIK